MGAHAATDVTGFGMLGHLLHILEGSQVGARIELASVPLMQNEISDAEGPGFDAKRLATTWEWVAKAQGMQIDALDPASAIDTSLSE